MPEHLQGAEVLLHGEEGEEVPRGPHWMPEHLQGAEVLLHGEEGEEVPRGPSWVPEHLQGASSRLYTEVTEDLLSVWWSRPQQAHLPRPHLHTVCPSVRHPHEDRVADR